MAKKKKRQQSQPGGRGEGGGGGRGRGDRKRKFSTAAAAFHHHGRHNNGGGRNPSGGDDRNGGGAMDDIRAQLERQRAKTRAQAEATSQSVPSSQDFEAKARSSDDIRPAEGGAAGHVRNANTSSANRPDSNSSNKNKRRPRSMGQYRYDPNRKAYFPAESYVKRPIGWKEENENVAKKDTHTRRVGGRGAKEKTEFASMGTTALRLSRCPTLRSMQDSARAHRLAVYTYQMAFEVSLSSRRRTELRSELATAVAGDGVRVVPTAQRRIIGRGRMVNGCTKRGKPDQGEQVQTESSAITSAPLASPAEDSYSSSPSSASSSSWAFILPPMQFPNIAGRSNRNEFSGSNTSSSETPFDCVCKEHLHPSARTFDVMRAPRGATPHIATIVGNGEKVHYRRSSFRNHADVSNVEGEQLGFSVERPEQCRSIRFAPFLGESRSQALVGALSSGATSRGSQFALGYPSRGYMMSYSGIGTISLEPTMNDFAFSPGSSMNGGMVAFASNQSAENRYKPGFLDLTTGQISSPDCRWRFASDAFCVEYGCPDTILYGHRKGVVSILDYRSKSISYTCKPDRQRGKYGRDSFGSVMSLRPLGGESNNHGNPYSFIAKGSFGPCHLYDMRKLGGDSVRATGSSNPHSLIQTMTVPSNLLSPTLLSTKCSGMAVDPYDTALISPFVSADTGPCLGLWCLLTGKFVREVRLMPDLVRNSGGRIQQTGKFEGPEYCELSSTTTPPWDLKFDGKNDAHAPPTVVERKGTFGVWLKCDAQFGAPREAGGIHHVSFPISHND